MSAFPSQERSTRPHHAIDAKTPTHTHNAQRTRSRSSAGAPSQLRDLLPGLAHPAQPAPTPSLHRRWLTVNLASAFFCSPVPSSVPTTSLSTLSPSQPTRRRPSRIISAACCTSRPVRPAAAAAAAALDPASCTVACSASSGPCHALARRSTVCSLCSTWLSPPSSLPAATSFCLAAAGLSLTLRLPNRALSPSRQNKISLRLPSARA